MTENITIKKSGLVLQALLVVFSVVLALTVNEVWRARQMKAQAADAKQRIVAELQANLVLIKESLAYHKAGIERLNKARQEETQPDFRQFNKGFVHPAKLTSTAWDATNMAGLIPHLRYADVLRFSELYELQDDYFHQEVMAGQAIFSLLLHEGIQGVAKRANNLMSIIYAFMHTESQMEQRYEEVLRDLEENR